MRHSKGDSFLGKIIKKGWLIMQAKKMILETDQYGRLAYQPSFPPNTRMEAIFLIIGENEKKCRRRPSSIIAKKGKILGDILSSVAPHEDWEVLK